MIVAKMIEENYKDEFKSDVNYFLKSGPIKTNSLNVRSVKVYGDGALGSRGATLKEPYSDDNHNYGKLVTDIESIKILAKKLGAEKAVADELAKKLVCAAGKYAEIYSETFDGYVVATATNAHVEF